MVVSVAIAVGVIAVLSGGLLAGRDNPGVSDAPGGPGVRFHDQGDTYLRPGRPRPAYDSRPPTSGAHVPTAVTRDGSVLSDDQLLQALSVGDVVLVYGTRRPPAGLRALADATAPPFTVPLATSGQAVILARRPGTPGVIGLAWAHMLRVAGPSDPALRAFVGFWLGRGAPHRASARTRS